MPTFARASARIAFVVLAVAATSTLAACASQRPTRETVDVIQLEGVIDPPTAEYLTAKLADAQADGVQAAIVQIDTPGGLDVSMRDIVQEMLDSEIPVIAWVAPPGARAASAGTFLVYASDVAYMAESTEIGAATPVDLGGRDLPDTLERKAINDAAAFLVELARTRGRNEQWAEAAVRDAASIGATEAARIDVVDGVASSLADVLEDLDGREVDPLGGAAVVLDTWDEDRDRVGAPLRFQNPNLLQQLLHAVVSPEVAFFLLLLGAFGLIFELYNPGIGLAGILGAIALILGLYGLYVLPTNWVGVLLIVLAIAFLVIDLQVAGLGVWTAGGVTALIAGGLVLFAGAEEALRLSPWAIAAGVALVLLFFVSVMTAALRVRLRRPITGEEAIVGAVGEAKTDIAPEGTVMTKGTLWRARTMETGIAAGSRVKVMATEGLVLLVEPLHEDENVEGARP